MDNSNSEPNPIYRYFNDPNFAIYRITNIIRRAFLDGKVEEITDDLIQTAQDEVQNKISVLDSSAIPFADDLTQHVFDGEQKQALLLVDGTFKNSYKKRNIPTILPIFIGNDSDISALLSSVPPYKTRDSYLTETLTTRYIEELKKNAIFDYNLFKIEKSRFFYIKTSDLERFYDNGQLDIEKLARVLSPTHGRGPKGYIVTNFVIDPSFKEYMEFAVIHVSHRLKTPISVSRALLEMLMTPEGAIGMTTDKSGIQRERHLLLDLLGYRPVMRTREDVTKLSNFLRGDEDKIFEIGNTVGLYHYTKDFYDLEKRARGFKSMTVVAEVSVRGSERIYVEIQVQDIGQYYHNEYHEKSKHLVYKGQVHLPPEKIPLYRYYCGVLGKIFSINEVDEIRIK